MEMSGRNGNGSGPQSITRPKMASSSQDSPENGDRRNMLFIHLIGVSFHPDSLLSNQLINEISLDSGSELTGPRNDAKMLPLLHLNRLIG